MSDIKNWSTVEAGNGFGVPNGFPEGMPPAGVNDSAREVMAAVRRFFNDSEFRDVHAGATIQKISGTQFKVLGGDHTAFYTVGRRIRIIGAATGQFFVASSSFAAGDTTVNTTAGTIPDTPTEVGVHQSPSLGSGAFKNEGGGGGLDADTVDGRQAAQLAPVTGLTVGDRGQWDGSAMARVQAIVAEESQPTGNLNSNPWTSTPAVATGNPALAVPAAGKFYADIHFSGCFRMSDDLGVNTQGSLEVFLEEENSAAPGTWNVLESARCLTGLFPNTKNDERTFPLSMHRVRKNTELTNGNTFTYRIRYVEGDGIWQVDRTSYLSAKLVPY